MNHNCPYLSNNKFCTYKNGNESKHKTICIYSNAQKCFLFQEWIDKLNMYESEEKVEQRALKSPQTTYKYRIKALIKKFEK